MVWRAVSRQPPLSSSVTHLGHLRNIYRTHLAFRAHIFLKFSSFESGGSLRKTAAEAEITVWIIPLQLLGLVLPQKTIKILLAAAKMLTMRQLFSLSLSSLSALFLFILHCLLNFHRGNKVPDSHQFYENDWQTWSSWTKDKKTNEFLEKWEANGRSNKSLTPHSAVTRQPERGSTSYRPRPDWLPSAEPQSQVHPIAPDY